MLKPEAIDFLQHALPCPMKEGDGWINLHWFEKSRDGQRQFMNGLPFKTLDEFVAAANQKIAQRVDVFVCQSRQAQTGTNKRGEVIAKKSKANAVALKSVWLDLDVGKDDEKKYPTVLDAMQALGGFVKKSGLDKPSAIVFTGGGAHAYWVSDRELTHNEWLPYATNLRELAREHGLLCDSGITTDGARILRIPGSFNMKTGTPRPTKLTRWSDGAIPGRMFDFAELFPNAEQYKGLMPRVSGAATTATTKLKAFLPLLNEPNKLDNEVVDPTRIFGTGGCPLLTMIREQGGKDCSQGMWNLTTLAATFMRDGNTIAHEMSHGYEGYTVEETQAMWDRKVQERRERGLGWPSCSAFRNEGSTVCDGCPHWGHLKGGPVQIATMAAPATAIAKAQAMSIVPDAPPDTAGCARANLDAQFRDLYQSGQPKPSLANAVIAICALGIGVRYDLFHHRIKVTYKGTAQTIREGLLTDDTVSAVRSLINNTYNIDCGPYILDAIKEIGFDNAYDPVLDMLNEYQGKWDGKERLDRWVVNYLGCENTPINRAIGRKTLIGACRRAREPGCKSDNITVLEGVEGTDKSTAIRLLAGDENFSDQSIIGASDKDVQEQLDGIWMHESADLAGMKRADVEHIKAFASRQVDRARPAYGRVREDRPRRSIEWGTTNTDEYLFSQTGNRRFWPLKTSTIHIEALKRDREQLLGEAATYEAAGESITLDPSLWGDAREVQEQRRVKDPWEDILERIPAAVEVREVYSTRTVTIIHRADDGYERVASADLLEYVLNIPKAQQTSAHGQRLGQAMKHAGWTRNQSDRVTINGKPVRGYIRPVYPTEPTGSIGARGISVAHGMTGPSGDGGAAAQAHFRGP